MKKIGHKGNWLKDTRGLLMFSYQFLCMTVITKSLNVYANLLKWFYSYSLYQKKITSPSLALVVQFSSVAQSCPTLCNPMNRSMPGLPVYHQLQELLKLMSIESVMPSSHLVLCRPLLLLPPIPPIIKAFSNESTLRMRWPKHWSFSFSISPSKEYPGLISFLT